MMTLAFRKMLVAFQKIARLLLTEPIDLWTPGCPRTSLLVELRCRLLLVILWDYRLRLYCSILPQR
jgi:hypothetical protein